MYKRPGMADCVKTENGIARPTSGRNLCADSVALGSHPARSDNRNVASDWGNEVCRIRHCSVVERRLCVLVFTTHVNASF